MAVMWWEHPRFCWVWFNYCYLCVNTPRACWSHWAGKLPGRLLLLSAAFKPFLTVISQPPACLSSGCSSGQTLRALSRAGVPELGGMELQLLREGWGLGRVFGNGPGTGQCWSCSKEMPVCNVLTSVPSHPEAPGEPGRSLGAFNPAGFGVFPLLWIPLSHRDL